VSAVRYHRSFFVKKGKPRQGTGGPTTGEWAAQEEESDHGKAHSRLCSLEQSSLPSACQQCPAWANSEVRRRKDAQQQSAAFTAPALRKITNVLFYKASVLRLFYLNTARHNCRTGLHLNSQQLPYFVLRAEFNPSEPNCRKLPKADTRLCSALPTDKQAPLAKLRGKHLSLGVNETIAHSRQDPTSSARSDTIHVLIG